MRVSGWLVSGRGKARGKEFSVERELTSYFKRRRFPGTANILLTKPIQLSHSIPGALRDGYRLFVPADINGIECMIYRYRGCPLHVLEVIAAASIRRELGLRDGDYVDIDVDARAPNLIKQAMWNWAWGNGKQGKYYTDDAYVGRLNKLGVIGRLAAQPTMKSRRYISP